MTDEASARRGRAARALVVGAVGAMTVGCFPSAGPEDASRQRVTVEPITLVLEPEEAGLDRAAAAGASADDEASGQTPADGPAASDGFASVVRAVRPEEPGARCPAWSTCEVHAVFTTNRELFRRCARLAPGPAKGATMGAGRRIAFGARLTVNREGTVTNAEVLDLSPSRAGLQACLAHALRELPFALGAPEATTTLDVSVTVTSGPRPR